MTNIAYAKVQAREVNYKAGDVSLKGYIAYDDAIKGKRPGILVVHEWWGHNQHARSRAKMLAGMGYTALALDMYGDEKFADHPQKAGEFMDAAFKDWEGSKAKFNEAKKVLQEHETVDRKKIGVIGFCFGGAVSLRLAREGEDLAGVAAFHSALPMDPPVAKNKVLASILVINGAEDPFLKPETVGAFMREMVEANVDLTYLSLPGIKHSFTNPQADEFQKKFNLPALAYDKRADDRSWYAMQSFFKRVFAGK
ncbi:MAG: dienelactone hydrolase [Nitrospinae bacterium RIFCSPLOWO2_12_FULL_47_7]|nr:MAG: dienelactone hydrolase [Nitrospinae bacterium RIFCSPLOWO2_12_FULL_47_7]